MYKNIYVQWTLSLSTFLSSHHLYQHFYQAIIFINIFIKPSSLSTFFICDTIFKNLKYKNDNFDYNHIYFL